MYGFEYIKKAWKPYLDFAELDRLEHGQPPLTPSHVIKMGNVMEADLLSDDDIPHIPFDMVIAMCDIDLKQGIITQEQYDKYTSGVEETRVELVGEKL